VDDSADPRALERVGSVLDEKWTLERILGSGGMGAVYAGRHRNGARGAVKVLHPELARRPEIRERFLREGYAANRVEHRGAVQVLDDDIVKEGPDEGTAYLVMEILDGESLEERIERGPPLTEVELLRILDDVLAVLEAAHEHGVVHRDLKPANLFLNKDPSGPSVKVLDFGLARLEEARSVTGVGLALGTPSFMAPEQANGRTTEIDARSDLFAVGATAFMILSGRGVHEADGVLELVARMGTLPAPKLRDVAPQVSEAVARIVDRALEFKREDRYPSAAEMRADVQSALSGLAPTMIEEAPASARAVASVREPPRTSTPVADADTREPTSAAPKPPKKERRSVAPFVLVLLVAAGLVLVLVPEARERTGMASTMAELLSAMPTAADASPLAPNASTGAAPPALSALPAATALDASSTATAQAEDASVDDAAPAGALASEAIGDASVDASDDDDDDDDVDASDAPAAALVARDAPAPAPAAHPHAPKPAPHRKQLKPRKKKRPRR
jgi:serine/threonine-protein kinase